MQSQAPSQAVVIGASMEGVLAARVLSRHFDRVVLIERGRAPQSPHFAVLEETTAIEPVANKAGTAVIGVRVRHNDQSHSVIESQLTIDASGRRSGSPLWLEHLGYAPVKMDEIDVQPWAGSRWRHYEHQDLHPAGFVIVGNAYCFVNNEDSQRSAIATLTAEALDLCLTEDSSAGLPFRVYRKLAQIVKGPWARAAKEDGGNRPRIHALLRRCTEQVTTLFV